MKYLCGTYILYVITSCIVLCGVQIRGSDTGCKQLRAKITPYLFGKRMCIYYVSVEKVGLIMVGPRLIRVYRLSTPKHQVNQAKKCFCMP